MPKPIVYMATNSLNGSRYIGATKKMLCQRRGSHEYDARNGKGGPRTLQAAIRFFGAAAFKWEAVSSFDNMEEAWAEETRLISELKSEYNLATGGRVNRGVPVTDELRRARSERQKGLKLSEESRQKLSASLKKAVRPADFGERISRGKKGKPLTEAHRAALSVAHKGKPMSAVARAVFKTSWVKGMKMDPAIVEKRRLARIRNNSEARNVSVAT